MNFDGGTGYVISAIVGSVVMWILGRFDRHSDRSKETVEEVHEKLDELEKSFLRYQAHVAESYTPKSEQREFQTAIFAKLDDIVKLINTKADK